MRGAGEPPARVAGTSKYGLSRTFRVITDLLAMHFLPELRHAPGHFLAHRARDGRGGLRHPAGWRALKIMGESIGNGRCCSRFFLVIAGLQLLLTASSRSC
jgi:hypothetical protein